MFEFGIGTLVPNTENTSKTGVIDLVLAHPLENDESGAPMV